MAEYIVIVRLAGDRWGYDNFERITAKNENEAFMKAFNDTGKKEYMKGNVRLIPVEFPFKAMKKYSLEYIDKKVSQLEKSKLKRMV